MCKVINYAVREDTSIESSCRELDTISSNQFFEHLEKLSISDVQNFLDKKIYKQTRKIKRKLRKPVTVAIDYTDIPYYGNKNPYWVVGGKRKGGTNYHFRYASLEIVDHKKKITLAALPINMFSRNEWVVKRLIERVLEYIEIKVVLLDRGFLSSAVIEVLKLFGLDFIMPAKLDRKILYIKKSVYGYKYGKSEVNLIVGNYKWITNMSKVSSKLSLLYKKRWGIETGYREKNKFRIITTTRNHMIRFLFFAIAVLFYNMWILENSLKELSRKIGFVNRITTRIFKKRFLGIP